VPFAQLKDYLLFENQMQETSEKIEEIFSRDRMMDQREMPPTIH
jgi:hypothetical protein